MHRSPRELWANRPVIYSQGGGGLADGPEHTVISTCCKECFIQAVWFLCCFVLFFCLPAAIFAHKTTGIYCQTTGASAHHEILCLQIKMNECQQCLRLKGHSIFMDITVEWLAYRPLNWIFFMLQITPLFRWRMNMYVFLLLSGEIAEKHTFSFTIFSWFLFADLLRRRLHCGCAQTLIYSINFSIVTLTESAISADWTLVSGRRLMILGGAVMWKRGGAATGLNVLLHHL